MFLDTVNINGTPVVAGTQKAVVFAPWDSSPHTRIHHHGGSCCEIAKSWFLSMDFAQLSGNSPLTGPRWIRERYQWGPSKHPIYWCEAVKQKTLDCGVLAAMAHECFTQRGVRSFPVQLVQQYSLEATAHWKDQWSEKNTPTNWIRDDVIYHEGNAVLLSDGTIKIWDASAAWWMNPSLTIGYGSLSALRIHDAKAGPDTVYHWGEHRIKANVWHNMNE
jgi:hypothetical protein